VVVAVLNIILAGPHDLHWAGSHLFGEQGRFDRKVAFRLAAEAAAQQSVVHRDVGDIHAESFGNILAGAAGALQRRPHL
jgi:hypothetical protein